MKACDVIHYLKIGENGYVDVGDEVLKPCVLTPTGRFCENDSWLQYKRRLPENSDKSIHYEMKCIGNEIEVAVHVENETDARFQREDVDALLERAAVAERLVRFVYGSLKCVERVDCVSYGSIEEAAERAKGLLKILYDAAEPVLSTLESNVMSGDLRQANVGEEELVENVLASADDPFPENCNAVVVTVEKLLSMNLGIPEYQRPYKWTRRNVEELIQDIKESLGRKASSEADSEPLKYRLGTVILDASCADGKFRIVDGQQRVLTLLLINRVLNSIRKNKVTPPILADSETLRFLSRNKVSRKNLHENYAVVKSCLAKDYELRKKLIVAFNSTLEMVVVKVSELSEAFQLFDSQNTRGRALNPHDLLKAFHLRAMVQRSRAESIAAEDAEDAMRSVVTEWEAQSEGSLRSLFDNWLFRISNWSKKRRTHPFAASDIHEFKGVPFDSQYSYALRARAAMPRDNVAENRRFQIGEDFEEGREFFRMVSHYLRMVEAARSDAYFKDRPEIKEVLAFRRCDGRGFSHVESMFRCALMSYVDRFGECALSEDPRVVDKLCLWAFVLRLDLNHVSEDSINKYAVIEGGADYTNTIPMFSVIKTARIPRDIAIQDVCGVNGSRYKRKRGVDKRERLVDALKKVEA